MSNIETILNIIRLSILYFGLTSSLIFIRSLVQLHVVLINETDFEFSGSFIYKPASLWTLLYLTYTFEPLIKQYLNF